MEEKSKHPIMLLFSDKNINLNDTDSMVRRINDNIHSTGMAVIPPSIASVVLLPSGVEKPVAVSVKQSQQIKQIGFVPTMEEGEKQCLRTSSESAI